MTRRRDAQHRIVEAALDAFGEHGYNGTTTSEIARRAGVAEGTIFRYFATKKDLLIGVVAPVVARVMAPIVKRNLETVFVTPYETPEAFMRAVLADRLGPPSRGFSAPARSPPTWRLRRWPVSSDRRSRASWSRASSWLPRPPGTMTARSTR
jgi:AcrR family transcriptional regulator